MNRILRLLAIVILLVLIAAAWVWWNRPTRADLAANAPADSLIYLESNNLLDVTQALTNTSAWQSLAPAFGLKSGPAQNRWFTLIARTAGIGSAQTVIAARSQFAFVMLDLNPIRTGDTMEFKSHQALIVETHTSQWRMKPAIERWLGDLANRAYGQPIFERIQKSDGEISRWSNREGNRKLVAVFDGTAAIVANDEEAASTCLQVRHGQRPSLAQQREIEDMRSRMGSRDALAFGYVSSARAPGLISQSLPLLSLRLPDSFASLVANTAPRLIGSLGWSAHRIPDGIEDRYFMSLKPGVLARLRPLFASSSPPLPDSWLLLPANTYSVTDYNVIDPSKAWETLATVLSSQVDVVAAVLLKPLQKAALESYGIDDANLLKAIGPNVTTARIDSNSDRAVIVARIVDESFLKQFIARRFGSNPKTEQIENSNLLLSSDGEFAAAFVEGHFLLGSPADLRRCLTERARHSFLSASAQTMSRVRGFHTQDAEDPAVETYTLDAEQSQNFLTTMAALFKVQSLPGAGEQALHRLPYSETQTRFSVEGIEYRKRSPFGLFSKLVSFLPVKN